MSYGREFNSYADAESDAYQLAGDTGEAYCVVQDLYGTPGDGNFGVLTALDADVLFEAGYGGWEIVYTADPHQWRE